MDEFVEGDLVCLKCGGPEIEVVCSVADYPFPGGIGPAVFCISDRGHFRFEQVYPPIALDVVQRARPAYERRRYER